MLRRILLASAGAMAVSGGAFAADLTRPPPLPVFIPQVLPWNGFYVGANAGGEWSSNNSVDVAAFAVAPALATASIPITNNGAFIGGGQIGYNYQFGPSFVASFETDIQGVAGTSGVGSVFRSAAPVAALVSDVFASKRVDYLGTVRGRLGFLINPTLMIYGTGGFAYGGEHSDVRILQTQFVAPVFTALSSGNISTTGTGWTAGGGVEWIFLPHWSAKIEYLYYQLSSESFALSPLRNPITGVVVAPFATTSFNGNIVRAGLNYHFNWGPPPVVSKY